MPEVEIRLLGSLEEFRACEQLQKEVWGTLGVSSELLSVVQKYGGTVLGALVKGRVVGFVSAFLARYHGRLIHWSHMMAVNARYRDQGVGFRMKLAHRKLALQQGIKAICWTYDPLQSRNATLNLRRLGARVVEYIPDCYGHFASVIEKGLPSDRFVVEWRIATRRVERYLRSNAPPPDASLPRVNETCLAGAGFVENRRIMLHRREPRLLVQIPSNTDAMRVEALPLARRWRMETREIFVRYFKAGYTVEDFLPPAADRGCFYLLGVPR
jgi:predicted GNAT superfamily acetyltransferase